MRLILTVAVLCCTPLGTASAQAQPQGMQNSFIEFKVRSTTTTYDLRTVEVIQPGKFVIVKTWINDPDVMRFKLKVLDTLHSHCSRSVGSYPAPADVFTLGPADMPVKEIEVREFTNNNYRYKVASWWLPYFKTMVGSGADYHSYRCNC
jgi:hypothetical protein